MCPWLAVTYIHFIGLYLDKAQYYIITRFSIYDRCYPLPCKLCKAGDSLNCQRTFVHVYILHWLCQVEQKTYISFIFNNSSMLNRNILFNLKLIAIWNTCFLGKPTGTLCQNWQKMINNISLDTLWKTQLFWVKHRKLRNHTIQPYQFNLWLSVIYWL